MNPIPASFLIGLIVALAKWSKGENISMDNVLGVAGSALTLGVLAAMNRDLARAFGALAVVGVALFQVPEILERAGFGSSSGPRSRGGGGGGGGRNQSVS